MNKIAAAALAAVLLSAAAIPAMAEDEAVTVTFESVVAVPAKDGTTLDPKLFSFGPAKAGAEDVIGHGQARGWHKPKDEACQWALLNAFLKFQKTAQAEGKRVVSVRTYAGDQESVKRDECLCLAGRAVVRTTVKAVYAK
ncbi:MAG TPA: hypothetical protein VNZ54_09055 [bacterium]|jgi:hypothetical protein|nr:hypothetical protein [bacterium]